MYKIILFFALLSTIPTMGQTIGNELYNSYDLYKEQTIKDRRFKHRDITRIVRKLPAPFKSVVAGKSIEGRDIHLVRIGKGKIKVLLWSQMHGDEPTATMAMMDIFNFFQAKDEFDYLRQALLEEITFYFIPMLNPDGAEKYERRNALGIDLNRDALRLQSPEARLLKEVRDAIDADWGFNLHDQNRYYGAGKYAKSAAISFLAPAYDIDKSVNEKRGEAMQVIAFMNHLLQEYIPQQVGKYNDTFEPRAFGDNIQKWGTRTILIESGAMKGDREKQYLRKLNFVMLMAAFDAIASQLHLSYSEQDYNAIPFNASNHYHDLILREVEVYNNNDWYTVDIAFRQKEVGSHQYYFKGRISELGDLSVYKAYENYGGKGYRALPGKVFPKVITSEEELKGKNVQKLWRNGYTYIRIEGFEVNQKYLPIQLLKKGEEPKATIKVGQNPALMLQKNGEIRAVVVNGQLYKLDGKPGDIGDWYK